MRIKTTNISIGEYIKITCFAVFFAWVSFFPEPIQGCYGKYTKIFLASFLLVVILNKEHLKDLFSFRDWPVWLFIVCLWSGTVLAVDKSVALRTYLYLVLTFFPLFYIGKYLYSSAKNINKINSIICICAAVVALIGLMELYFGKNILYEKFILNPFYERYVRYNQRLMSTQFNPAVLGSYLLGCLSFGLYFFKNKSLSLRRLGVFSSLLCVVVILLTFSRGVYLGLIALVSFYLWKMNKKKFFILFLGGLILLITVCSFQEKQDNFYRFGFKRLIMGSYDSVISEYRFTRVKMSFEMFKDYPFFGIGFNHFRARFNEYCPESDKGKESHEFMIPDNMYLTFLAETGIIGTGGFLIFIFFLFKRGFKQLSVLQDDSKKRMLLIAMSALIGLMVNMGAYELFYWSNPYMFFCLICGFIQGVSEG